MYQHNKFSSWSFADNKNITKLIKIIFVMLIVFEKNHEKVKIDSYLPKKNI